MSHKKIGIPGWNLGDNAWGVTKPYLEFFSNFGQVEILTPRKGIVKDIGLLVLPGGMDMNPNSYGETPGFMTGSTDVFKQYFYDQNLEQYINAGIPIFSVCLGMQNLNVFFGGSLLQHGYFPYTERTERKEVLTITLPKEDQDLCKFTHQYKVNSMHHQAVTTSNISNELVILATATETKNVEAFKHKSLPIYGVQWHPSLLWGISNN